MDDNIFDLIKEARKQAQRGDFMQARHLYTTSIDQIRRRINSVHVKQRTFWTVELWLTLSELLSLRSDSPEKGESFEECRRMRLNSLRFLYKAVASASEYISEDHRQKLVDLQENTIHKFGCIVPETDTQLKISCPIYIRNSLPFPTQLAMHLHMRKMYVLFVKETCCMKVALIVQENYTEINFAQ